jgi:hypothetical protein
VRVQRSLQQLAEQLQQLVNLATPIQHVITPEPEPALSVLGINPNAVFLSAAGTKSLPLTIIGTGFDISPKVPPFIKSVLPIKVVGVLSDNLIYATLDLSRPLNPGPYPITITVTNRNEIAPATLQTEFTVMP